MRLILLLCALLVLGAEESKLPVEVQRTIAAYDAEILKINQERATKEARATERHVTTLTRAMEVATRRGDLEGALAIKAVLDEVNAKNQELRQELLGMQPRKATWLDGAQWQIVWSGSRNFVDFAADGTMKRQDGAVGTFEVADDGLATLTWDDGRVWTVNAPPKSTPDRTSGRNHAGTTVTVSKER
jgi:hypothetical protein